MPQPPRAVLLDAFGTMFDPASAMRRHAARLGPSWEEASREWRTLTLEYAWVRSLAGGHEPFSVLSREALDVVARRRGLDAGLVEDVARGNGALDAYPDVAPALDGLREAGLACAVLSNGEAGAMARQVDAAGLSGRLDALLSAEAAGVFKPDPRAYAVATAHFGCAASELAFVSSNAWDAFGAAAFGFRVVWVNRHCGPVEYGLEGRATVLAGLDGLADVLSGARA